MAIDSNGKVIADNQAIGAQINEADITGTGGAGIKSWDSVGMDNGWEGGKFSTDTTNKSAGGFGDMFSSKNMGGTLSAIGSIAGAAAGIYDAHNKKKYQDKVFGMEEQRVARATARQDKQQSNYDKVFG